MQIQNDTQYWYTKNNERQGPVTGAALVQLAQQGVLAPADLVWCDGMPQWTAASSFTGLFAGSPATAPAFPPQAPGMPSGGYGAPAAAPAGGGTPTRAMFPMPLKGGANFGLWLGLILAYLAAVILGVVIMASAGYDDVQQAVGGVVIAVGVLLLIGAMVVGAINIYRSWVGLQGLPGVSTTPGKGVGFCFIPFFNLYWVFIVFSKWSQDYNKFVRANNLQGAPAVNEGLFLACSILIVAGAVPLINYLAMIPEMVVGIMCMSQLCKAVNYLKTQSDAAVG